MGNIIFNGANTRINEKQALADVSENLKSCEFQFKKFNRTIQTERFVDCTTRDTLTKSIEDDIDMERGIVYYSSQKSLIIMGLTRRGSFALYNSNTKQFVLIEKQ